MTKLNYSFRPQLNALGLSARYLEITESLENEKITVNSKGKYKYPWMGGQRVTVTVTYTLKPVEEGTKLTYAMDYEMSYLERFGKGYLEKSIEKSLNNLKNILEK